MLFTHWANAFQCSPLGKLVDVCVRVCAWDDCWNFTSGFLYIYTTEKYMKTMQKDFELGIFIIIIIY